MEFERVNIKNLNPNSKNPNKHSPEQIQRLIELIKHYGWRHPIIVSNQSGYVVVGHGRLEAATAMGLKEVPVHYQDFENEDTEYGFMVADNAIASWAELDLGAINLTLPELGPDFNIDLLGIKDFQLDIPNFAPGTEDEQGKLDQKKPIICPKCGESFVTP